jgi:hypothetical protein
MNICGAVAARSIAGRSDVLARLEGSVDKTSQPGRIRIRIDRPNIPQIANLRSLALLSEI